MKKISKGQTTQRLILDQARNVFNNDGINLTLKDLADKLGVTLGRITNHFPTKDHVFAGLSKQYHEEFLDLMKSFDWKNEYSLSKLHELTGIIMDLQYKHRCLLLFVCATSINQKIMISQIRKSWKENLGGFEQLITTLIQTGLLKNEALKKANFVRLQFQYINLFTTWLVSYTIYDTEKPYRTVKPIYQKGITETLYPYFTKKGHAQLGKIK